MKRRDPTGNNEPPNGEMVIAAVSQSFSGPLPHPDALARYNEILPGAAERILAMAESQLQHRQTMENSAVKANIQAQKLGTLLGFVLAIVAIVGGIYLAVTGKPAYGLAAIIAPLAGLAGVFVIGKRQQKSDRDQKARDLALARSTRR